MNRGKIFLIVLSIVLGAMLFSAFGIRAYVKYQLSPVNVNGQNLLIEIKPGQNTAQIAQLLQEKGLIHSSRFFVFYVKYFKKSIPTLISSLLRKEKSEEINLKFGTYEFSPKMSLEEIYTALVEGKIKRTWITIPEGWRLEQIADYLAQKRYLRKEDFLSQAKVKNYIKIYSFLENTPLEASLEGFLFPDTYDIGLSFTADSIIRQMLDNFDKKLDVKLRKEIKKSGYSIFEIITLASIVERESSIHDDRRGIAGVYFNRLKNDYPLQSDATINYITKKPDPTPSHEDTQIVSPYNTYLNSGLPIGPICNPGLSAIKATIYPKKHNYFYFLSALKTDSRTIFSKTYEEHLRNKAKYID